MSNFDTVLDETHEIRENLYNETKGMKSDEEAKFYNEKAEKLLKAWGIKLKKADYLLEAVSGKK